MNVRQGAEKLSAENESLRENYEALLKVSSYLKKDDKEDTFKKFSRACKRFSLLSLRCLKGIDIWCTSAIKEVIRLSMLLLMPVVMIIGMHLVASFSGSTVP